MLKVLFVCVHNSARSQMAEAFLNRLSGEHFEAESAGLEEGVLNPLVVKAMDEIGIDISKNKTDSVFDFYRKGKAFSIVIKVCDEINGQRCPIFPSALHTLSWNIADPADFKGNEEEKLQETRRVRDEIRERVEQLISEYKDYSTSRK
ncbi:arsenate reductase ArsC [Youngiibacter multivorans]|uniref:Arsenate reductase n=1 Tax=Youngiibacter multivorans TaxID=937251 RepID=A0ABS4G432_9CLOT|nr:arsenate reductase ArsC [Youngiibacter multivorans]MBP1919302.1 arsenate reductase [Youngiibacter multivorans]